MYIAIDVGGTYVRIAAAQSLEDVTNFTKKEFALTHDFDKDFSTLIEGIKQLADGKITAIGMGTPGKYNSDKSEIISDNPNLLEWKNQPIKQLLEEAFPCRVWVDNDAVLAGLGEAVYGKVKTHHFTYIIWGTGIGTTVVTWSKGAFRSEKLDWLPYRRAWENDCGGNKIKEHFGKNGSELSEAEWTIVMHNFTTHLASFIAQLQPDTIIFGGGIAIKQSARLVELAKYFPTTTIQVSSLGEDAGIYGAFALIKNEITTKTSP